jgi:hypothetical protein
VIEIVGDKLDESGYPLAIRDAWSSLGFSPGLINLVNNLPLKGCQSSFLFPKVWTSFLSILVPGVKKVSCSESSFWSLVKGGIN